MTARLNSINLEFYSSKPFATLGLTLHKEGKGTATDVEQPRLGCFLVQYELLRVLPLDSIKKYLLVNSRWRV